MPRKRPDSRSLSNAARTTVESLEPRLLFAGGSIAGVVYNDANGNGVVDGEAGLAGRQVYLDLQGIGTLVAGDPVSITDAAGNYAFTNLAAGNYLARLVPLANHVATQPVWGGKFFVQLGANQAVTGENFLDAPVVRPSVTLANGQLLVAGMGNTPAAVSRFNADGSVDTTYGNLGVLTIPAAGGVATAISKLPDGRLSVTFPGGSVTLTSTGAIDTSGGTTTLTAPTALVATSPSPTAVHLTFTDNSTNEASFAVERSATANGPWASVGSVTGTSGTGTRTFDDNGVTAGTTYFYRVYAVSGAAQSAVAGPVSVTTSGGTIIVTSGATITGTLFNDANGNGLRDAGETGAANKQVYLDLQGLGSLVAGDPIATTDATGKYTFTALTAGNYIVRPVATAGQVTTSPIWGGKYFIQLATNQTVAGEDFGIETPATSFALGTQLLVAGTSNNQPTLSRFNADGSVDVPFGSLGTVTLPATVSGQPTSAVLQGGNIVVTYPAQTVKLGSNGAILSIVATTGGVTVNAPSGLTATAASATSVNLSFNDNSTNEQSFTIQRASSASGPWTTVANLPGTASTGPASAADTTASPATTYYYRVFATLNGVNSAVAGPVSVTTPATPGTGPTLNGASITGTVYFDANSNLQHDAGESGAAGRQVYLDLQGLGSYVAGDPLATTAADGSYVFTGLAAANYLVRFRPQGTDALTYPYPQFGGLYFISLGANQVASGKDFGLAGAGTPVIPPTNPTGHLSVGAIVNTSKLSGSESTAQIAVNPANPNNLVIVSQSGDNNGDLLPFSRSFDGGKTWATSLVGAQDGLNPGNPRPDAHVAFDSFGNLYMTYMVAAASNEIRIVVLRSTDGGQSFTSLGAVASGAGSNPDSPWIATGPSATHPGGQGVWVTYTDYNTNRIMIAGGTATGLGQFGGWSSPRAVNQSFGTFSTVAVGPAGQLAVSWQSTDGGAVVANSLDINYDASGTGNQFSADTLMASTNIGALDPIPAQPNRTIDAEARIAFDRSGGATNGRLYLVYTNGPISGDPNTDVYLKYSDTLGASWSSPLKVNDDATNKSQFLPAIAVDQTTGNVGLSWLDSRNSADNTGAELFATVSLDHGQTVQPNVQVAAALSYQAGADPNTNDLDFGDQGSVAFNAGKLIPVWSDNSNSTGDNPGGTGKSLDVYASVITVS